MEGGRGLVRTQVVEVSEPRNGGAVSADGFENASCWLGDRSNVFDLREGLQSLHFTINGGADSLSSCSA